MEKGELHQNYDLISGAGTELIRKNCWYETYDLGGNTQSAKGE
jgi:hypothetical protein